MSRLVALVLMLVVFASAGADEKALDAFLYTVRIGPEGRVLTIEPQADARIAAPAPAVDAALRDQLLARRYIRTDTRGGTLTTWLEGRFASASDGAAKIVALRSGPRPVRLDPPHAPAALIRDKVEADLVVRLKIGLDGKASVVAIDGIEALGSDHARRLEERIEYTAEVWRFQPERWDGRTIEGDVVLQVQYRAGRGDSTDWTWRGAELQQAGPLQVPAEDFRALDVRLSGKRS
jgi:hypothetical protein